MRLMQDITEYVDLTGLEATHVGFASAVREINAVFSTGPKEFRVGPLVLRRLLSQVKELGVSVAVVDDDGRITVMDVPLRVLQEPYDPYTVLAIMDEMTYAAFDA